MTYVGSPHKIGAALQGTVHGLYRGCGISIGYLLVSIMLLKFGYSSLFLGLGLIFFAVFGIYVTVMHLYPKRETIAEEHSLYSLIFDKDDDDDYDDDGTVLDEKPPKTGYINETLDTSFLK